MSPTGNGKTILVAEDELQVRTFVRSMLRDSGYQVLVAVDGLDALEVARKHTGPIHLLLSDVEMPRMTGVELATQLQNERPETQVLLMSGMTSGMLVLNEGWQFLPKPFMVHMLKVRVHHLLGDGPPIPTPPPEDQD